MRAALAPTALLLLLVWAISVAGATGWSFTANACLFAAALVLLAIRRFA